MNQNQPNDWMNQQTSPTWSVKTQLLVSVGNISTSKLGSENKTRLIISRDAAIGALLFKTTRNFNIGKNLEIQI